MQHTLSNTATGDPAGTFAYAAPEMLMGEKWDDKVCILLQHTAWVRCCMRHHVCCGFGVCTALRSDITAA